ncbi:uncharacterized protein N7529_004652 [Penicillium soppii]|uniref:uncharacterized protein n=1 Tax=Penicillium soppii TaxID=69789 RepID=UPI0025483085|nr:uncharacterized protein N7529_004652 [Penicillium soppii]KAJ5872299.1 hypothetical protein N7529_004652 [Penicillium soppii]
MSSNDLVGRKFVERPDVSKIRTAEKLNAKLRTYGGGHQKNNLLSFYLHCVHQKVVSDLDDTEKTISGYQINKDVVNADTINKDTIRKLLGSIIGN